MVTSIDQKKRLSTFFSDLQNQVIQSLEEVESEHNPNTKAYFHKKDWQREDPSVEGGNGGGGTMAVMYGDVFEKVGVNISTVYGEFPKAFAKQIPGASEDPRFWASGTSFVAHPKNPFVPIAHMNVRHIITSKCWFGGGGDLSPTFPFDEDTKQFHESLKKACDDFNPDAYKEYKEWCDEYFFIAHRNEPRGVGGIFFDDLNSNDFEKDFTFIQDVAYAFFRAYTAIVRKRMNTPWTDNDREKLLIKRSRYVEFNLIYDRGTAFGIKTGGNIEAILMSLPPEAKWP